MKKKELPDYLYELANDYLDLENKYRDKIDSYEFFFMMIHLSVNGALTCAPNEIVGIEMIMVAIQQGIKNRKEEKKNEKSE